MADEPMDVHDPDSKLMIAYQQGDQEAFDYLLDKYHRPIVNFIYKFVNNAAEAEDLAQEVFLRIHRARMRYEPRAKFASWIYRIAANLSLKEIGRRRRVFFWKGNHNANGRGEEEELPVPDPLPNAERRMISSEMGRIIRNAIQALPPKERLALVLRRYEDLSYRDIAEIMNCTEAAVKTYIHRGKLHVRDRILPYLQKGSA
jgi:RNA polymerase sigma-70 factor (ECF subfamily)